MIEAIARLRRIADDTEDKARELAKDRDAQSEMIDVAMQWRWVAAQASKICEQQRKLNGSRALCADCSEQCCGEQRCNITAADKLDCLYIL